MLGASSPVLESLFVSSCCVYMYIYMYVCGCIYTRMYVCVDVYTCIYIYVCVCLCVLDRPVELTGVCESLDSTLGPCLLH